MINMISTNSYVLLELQPCTCYIKTVERLSTGLNIELKCTHFNERENPKTTGFITSSPTRTAVEYPTDAQNRFQKHQRKAGESTMLSSLAPFQANFLTRVFQTVNSTVVNSTTPGLKSFVNDQMSRLLQLDSKRR